MNDTRSLCIASLFAATTALPGQGYEWDHADDIGVRYLLYKKMERRAPNPDREGEQLKLAFIPSDDADYVKIKGLPMTWGVKVYEFRPQVAEKDPTAAANLGEFLKAKDPDLRWHRRRFIKRDQPKESLRVWEYEDRYLPRVWVEKRSKGGLCPAHCSGLDIQFRIDPSLTPISMDQQKFGPNAVVRLRAPSSAHIRIPGRKYPAAWSGYLRAFPATGLGIKHPRAAATYEEYIGRPHKNRTFVTRGEPRKGSKLPFRLWHYYDDYRPTGDFVVFHSLTAVYQIEGREIALQIRWPETSERVDPKWRKRAMHNISHMAQGAGMPNKRAGLTNYRIAASHRIDDREVAIVVDVPMPTGGKPDRKLLRRARKMALSLSAKSAPAKK